MTAGVYKLEFSSGKYYLGKSEDCETRWKTHRKNFEQGTHTKKMQWEYLHHGAPQYSVLLETHPDHCHIFEAILIDSNWGPELLNTTRPKVPDYETSLEYLQAYSRIQLNNEPIFWSSTLTLAKAVEQEHKKWLDAVEEYSELEEELLYLESSGIRLPEEVAVELTELKGTVRELKHQNQEYTQELTRLRNRSWWQRLWNV